MKPPSQLEQFLSDQHSQGTMDEEGSFSLDQKRALQKIAEFQLPFPGAWAVKVVQAAVAAGAVEGIEVTQTATETRFSFDTAETWTPQQVEEALLTTGNVEQSLDHLRSALRAVGLNEKRGFELTLPGHRQAVVWNGTRFARLKAPTLLTRCGLTVTHGPARQRPLEWFKTYAQAGTQNAEVAKALEKNCYVCPVPLTLDTRRLDALYFCPSHGFSSRDFPLEIKFEAVKLPGLRIPLGTFERLPILEITTEGKLQFKDFSAAKMSDLKLDAEAAETTSLALLLSAHAVQESGLFETKFRLVSRESKCYWISDGAVVGEDRLAVEEHPVSVACFLSAQGLPTDLTSMQLRIGPQRSERLDKLGPWARDMLPTPGESELSLIAVNAKVIAAMLGGALLLGAAGLFVGTGLGLIGASKGVLATLGAGVSFARGGKREEALVADLQQALTRLRADFDEKYPS